MKLSVDIKWGMDTVEIFYAIITVFTILYWGISNHLRQFECVKLHLRYNAHNINNINKTHALYNLLFPFR
jgi:hypothetical protein